ncbi:MAG: alpha/beta hydrolase [Gammaproteobacteria bacterium]|nr:alpha/beta hydrolase [Gammaproteobacteria bacterium]
MSALLNALTKYGARLQCIYTDPQSALNWMFIPGGLGLGSESLLGLTAILKGQIPGSLWLFDFPNDGSNISPDHSIENWAAALQEAVLSLENTVIVAHSTGGMIVQSLSELEPLLTGLVLLDSAPDTSWQLSFADYAAKNSSPEIQSAERAFASEPNDETLRELVLVTAHYSFNDNSLAAGLTLFRGLPINYRATEWMAKNFDSSYVATWIPAQLPTLILGGNQDRIISLSVFTDKAEYHRENITFKPISQAGHYPWHDNPEEVLMSFKSYCGKLRV